MSNGSGEDWLRCSQPVAASRASGKSDERDRLLELKRWARGLGAVQEAERVGSWRIGTEHLLSACLLDPLARGHMMSAGVDIRRLQRQLGRPVRAGVRAPAGLLPTTDQMYFSDGARDVLDRLATRVLGDATLSQWVQVDHSTDPQGRSIVRRRLLIELLRHEAPAASSRLIEQVEIPGLDGLIDRLNELDRPSAELAAQPDQWYRTARL